MLYPIRIYQSLNFTEEMDRNKWPYNLKNSKAYNFLNASI